MKIIDLLNKIANGEEVPKEVEVGLHHFIYENDGEYYNESDDTDLLFDFDENYPLEQCLNQSVYPITYEEEKGIPEKLDYCEENTFMIKCKENSYLTREEIRLLDSNFKELGNKINFIIDYLKSKGE